MDKKWHDLEALLRRGDRAATLRGVQELTQAPLNAADRLQVARLYRKAGLPGRALQILGPWKRQSSELERAEYGAALVNLGAVREGLKILDQLPATQNPRVTWIRAAQLIRQWDWMAAIPLLERLPQSEMYLATCLIHGTQDYERASRILESMIRAHAFSRVSPREDPRLVQATAWLLLAQSHTLADELGDAEKALHQARSEIARPRHGGPTLLTWMIRQWELLLMLRRAKGRAPQALKELLGEVQGGFRALGGWEWARGCPLFAAEIRGDSKTLERLYWTTPYPAFHARIEKRLGPLPANYELRLGSQATPRLDVVTGVASGSRGARAQLKPAQAKHRLLIALVSDFHQPHRIAELHEKVFPEDGYRPEVSADRVHKVLRRLREWLARHDLGIGITATHGGFELQAHRGCRMILSQNSQTEKSDLVGPALDSWFRTARDAFGDQPFTSRIALQRLGGSRRTLARRLSLARAAGLLISSGAGPTTTYRAVSAAFPSPVGALAPRR